MSFHCWSLKTKQQVAVFTRFQVHLIQIPLLCLFGILEVFSDFSSFDSFHFISSVTPFKASTLGYAHYQSEHVSLERR